MIRIEPSIVRGVEEAQRASDLYPFLQGAMKLEHATIPVYLTAYFSLQPGTNADVATMIRSAVVEEMLHLVIAANVLNALGGDPVVCAAEFVPSYPGTLPMGVDGDLVVHVAPMSLAQCDVFLDIEEPEKPFAFPSLAAEETFETIGTFYAAIIGKIQALGDKAFREPSHPQVTGSWFGPRELFPVADVASAVAALRIVVEQGEGTSTSPLDAEGDVAHYYRFCQIKHGRRLVADASAPDGFSYTGDPLVFDPSTVWPLGTDPHTSDYPEGTRARLLVDQFNRSYTALLRALDQTFNGRPGQLDAAIGLMYELRLAALEMIAEPHPLAPDLRVTPTWEFVDRSA